MTQQEKDHFRYWLINEVGVYLQVADKIIKHVDHYFARPVESDAVELSILFENNFDCYADMGDDEKPVTLAMTKERFVEVVAPLIAERDAEIVDLKQNSAYYWQLEAYAKDAEILRLREALENLVALKEWKDRYGKDDHYTALQPAAWKAAKAALNP